MNSFTTKKYLIVAVLSIVLSLAIVRWHSKDAVPFCVNSAGCSARETLRGKVTTTTYGFPATYRQVEKFNPANTNEASGGYAGFAEATIETQGFSVPGVVTNIVFWFALLHLLSRFIKPKKMIASKDITQEDVLRVPNQNPNPNQTPTPPAPKA